MEFWFDNSKWADDFENTTSMFGGYMTHQNVSESKRPFQNWKSFGFLLETEQVKCFKWSQLLI